MERRRVIFQGRVQGVGFRATTQVAAAGFAVTGWVRNDRNGTVTMEVQGEPAEIDACLAALRERMGRYIRGETAEASPVMNRELGFSISVTA